jgi:flagellar biosynthesis/type III secretory pathway chaperone
MMSAATIDLSEVMQVTEQLNRLLLEECALLAGMKVRDLGPLQEEKTALSQRLELFQRALATDNSAVVTADEPVRERLMNLAQDLTDNIQENLRLTTIAQSVNRRVMQTFVEVLAEQQRVAVYGNQGQTDSGPAVTVSVNINEQA